MAALIRLVTSITPALSHLVFGSAIPVLAPQYIASIIAIYAAVAYLLDAHGAPTETRAPAPAVPLRRGLIRLGALFLPLFACVALNPLHPLPPHHPTQVTPGARMPHQHPPLPVNGTTASTCVRRALPPSSRYERPDGAARPAFGAFDDVLLVVFFSHPRYDINLDAHREVYAPYFPNVRASPYFPPPGLTRYTLDLVHRSGEPRGPRVPAFVRRRARLVPRCRGLQRGLVPDERAHGGPSPHSGFLLRC